ncbi:Bug family tripartite tricarboxylate transporter substrate binding protein [Alcaligenes faecalis]|uniref:Bug family tripartite tricarboxylate transporter substrate binding protein n=1 Tax=Alcaligenes faecalis TaxID=511 RepID=UPI00122C3724|nr:tripartite tricarboxylate transporter substrate binding protein [Alcaligenes faecalis]KAA1283640.1 tripartite tricarboxylate transporter substrate binding protein [Alcaligenes faecalis]
MLAIKKTMVGLVAALGLGAVGPVWADYPDHPVRVVIPYPPGAAGDIIFRILQPELSRELGQTVITDYKTGAGGNIGTQMVARSKPDGYTLLFSATNNFVINQFLYKNMGYDPFKDLHVINKVADAAAFVYVNGELLVKNMAEFRDYVQQRKGQVNYGTPGAGTTPELSAWKLSEALEGDMLGIHYRGSAPGIQALLSNEVQMFVSSYGLGAAFLPEGRLKALAVALPDRFPALPDVPTMEELGYKDVVISNWWALAVPAGTDTEIVAKIEGALEKVLADPEIRKKLLDQGYLLSKVSSEEFRKGLPAEADYWHDIVTKAGISLD